MGAMSLAVTVGSATAGTASLVMNIVLLISVVVSGAYARLSNSCSLLRLGWHTHAFAEQPRGPSATGLDMHGALPPPCCAPAGGAAVRALAQRPAHPSACPWYVPAGMLVNPESMEGWIRWTHYLSIFFYSYSAMMVGLC